MDLFYILLIVACFSASVWLVYVCEKLGSSS